MPPHLRVLTRVTILAAFALTGLADEPRSKEFVGPPRPPYPPLCVIASVRLDGPNREFRPMEPIAVTIAVRNITAKNVVYEYFTREDNLFHSGAFDIGVLDSRGKAMTPTRFYHSQKSPCYCANAGFIGSGGPQGQFIVNRLFDMTLSDTYTIKVVPGESIKHKAATEEDQRRYGFDRAKEPDTITVKVAEEPFRMGDLSLPPDLRPPPP